MTKEQILSSLKETKSSELERMSFVYIRLVEHLTLAGPKETREREKARIKIALKLINKWFNEYDN